MNDRTDLDNSIIVTTIKKNTDSDSGNVWKGFKFPMGAFMVWSKHGRMAWGKCDPITNEVIEWNEACTDELVQYRCPPD